jgi:hypothetical protein
MTRQESDKRAKKMIGDKLHHSEADRPVEKLQPGTFIAAIFGRMRCGNVAVNLKRCVK